MKDLPEQQVPDLEKKWERMQPPTPVKVGGSLSFWKIKKLFQIIFKKKT